MVITTPANTQILEIGFSNVDSTVLIFTVTCMGGMQRAWMCTSTYDLKNDAWVEVEWVGVESWSGMEWNGVDYDSFKKCWPARPAHGCFFLVKWTLLELSSAKKNRMTKIMMSKTFPIWRFAQTALV